MSKRVDEPRSDKQVLLPLHMLNVMAIILSVAIILIFLASVTIEAFQGSTDAGLRSLAATLLPPIIITYIVFFTPFIRSQTRIPEFSLYFVFTLWSLILFILVSNYLSQRSPAGELALSITLTSLIYIYRTTPFRSFISCAYGILSGFLFFVLFFGVPD
ncbi:MAG: hypothetical protein HC881_19050 [Leptolyngbyaceae cyanobacterium SL_7_1]|nr:hypothetical protein [Leptolyngbyaceae cyanobacterium SL_7_1]